MGYPVSGGLAPNVTGSRIRAHEREWESATVSDVFISYSRTDQSFVRHLVAALQAAGRNVWVDWNDILPSAKWHEEINAAIDDADAFVFVISPDSLSSQTCSLELAHALDARKRIIPLLHREVD